MCRRLLFQPITTVLLCSYLLRKNACDRYCIINYTMTLGVKVSCKQRKLGCRASAQELPEVFSQAALQL